MIKYWYLFFIQIILKWGLQRYALSRLSLPFYYPNMITYRIYVTDLYFLPNRRGTACRAPTL